MARFHMSAHATIGVAGRNDDATPQLGGIQIPGQPEDDPDLYVVVAAARIALPPGTRYVCIQAVTGAVYAKSGFLADDDIAAPAGLLVAEGNTLFFGVSTGHTHLLVIEANPTTDTATDLNA